MDLIQHDHPDDHSLIKFDPGQQRGYHGRWVREADTGASHHVQEAAHHRGKAARAGSAREATDHFGAADLHDRAAEAYREAAHEFRSNDPNAGLNHLVTAHAAGGKAHGSTADVTSKFPTEAAIYADLIKYNQNHAPAGSAEGGEFIGSESTDQYGTRHRVGPDGKSHVVGSHSSPTTEAAKPAPEDSPGAEWRDQYGNMHRVGPDGLTHTVHKLLKFNQHHAPAGSPVGGQFSSADGNSSTAEHTKNLKELLDRINEPDSGFTYQPLTEEQPSEGYAVSPYPDRSFAKAAKDLTLNDLAEYAAKNADVFSKADHYIGGWHDPASGKVFLDVSVVSKTPEAAHALAVKHDQIAYYDFKAGKSVTVNKDATSGGVAKGDQYVRYQV